jgi:GNAT superfamily N-acetyltransferase
METADTEAVGRVHARAWQATYADVMPGAFLAAIDPAARAEQWRVTIGRHLPLHAQLVADVDCVQVGFAAVGLARNDPQRRGEVYAINVDPDWIGRGVGQPLFARAVAVLDDFGFSKLVLWVVRENARARRFYERNGWVADDAEQRVEFGDATVVELRYRSPDQTAITPESRKNGE